MTPETGETFETDAADQPVDNQEQEAVETEKTIPMDAFLSLRAEQDRLKEQMQIVTDQNQLFRENLSALRNSQKDEPQEAPKDDTDLVSWGEARKMLMEQRNEMQELRMQQAHPDYQDTINKYLSKAIKEDPTIARDINLYMGQGLDAAQYAYSRVKSSKIYQDATREIQKSDKAQKIVNNSRQPGNLSQLGTPAPVNAASPYQSMGDSDFRALMNKNLGLI